MKNKIIGLAIILLTATPPLFAEMYRYIDESGQVVYSQFKPKPGVEISTVKAPPPPPSTAEKSRQQLVDSLQKRVDAKQDKKEAEEKSAKADEDSERKMKNCEAAKRNLANLTASDNRKLVDRKGNVVEISEAKRKQQIQKAQEVIKRDCK